MSSFCIFKKKRINHLHSYRQLFPLRYLVSEGPLHVLLNVKVFFFYVKGTLRVAKYPNCMD